MNIYACDSYKEVLKTWLEAHNGKGKISYLASLCGCERSYLSQVLHGKADLTTDHMIQFCQATGLSENEERFCLLLLMHDRSSSRPVRESLRKKINRLKTEYNSVSNQLSESKSPQNRIDESQKDLYYSNHLYSAVHILTSSPRLQTAAALSEELSVPRPLIEKTLHELAQMKLVFQTGDRFKHAAGDIFTLRDDPRTGLHHWNWRRVALEGSNRADEIHYTDVFTVDQKDIEKIRDLCLRLIKAQGDVVGRSGTEAGAVLCLDFFPIVPKFRR